MNNLVERLRARRMLANSGGVIGYGHSNARPTWITCEPDQDCTKAAEEIERLRAEVVRLTAVHDHQHKMAGLMLREAERSAAAEAAASRAQWCGVNVEHEEDAACYRWLRANWGRLTTHTSYEGGINEPRKVREITILPGALGSIDQDSLHRAILRAMSEGEKAC